MIIKFIDIENGELFDGTGTYVHWFENGQSTNLFYVKPMRFICDCQNVDIASDSTVFRLIVPPTESSEVVTLHNKDFYNLTGLIVPVVHSQGVPLTQPANMFIHTFYVIAYSDKVGEVQDVIRIGDDVEVKMGADFYTENETLGSNLENLGVEIPDAVQRSIYETNVYEECRDNITLNKKWKELLLQYWELVAQKGSYKSLLNGLEWFEYGDLLSLADYWQRQTKLGHGDLLKRELGKVLDEEFRRYLSHISKTTYLGIHLALETPNGKYESDSDVNPVYDGQTFTSLHEDVPVLEKVALKWGVEEMMLKMALLGNFFATYFVPIHMDVIHSCVEDMVFSNSIKVLSASALGRYDYFNNIGSFWCNRQDGEAFLLEPVMTHVYNNTIFGGEDWSDEGYFGTEALRETDGTLDDAKWVLSHTFGGIGCVIPFTVYIRDNVWWKNENLHDFIKKSTIVITNETTGVQKSLVDINLIHPIIEHDTGLPGYVFNFNILVTEPGHMHFSILFESMLGFTYSREFRFDVEDTSYQRLEFYKVNRIPVDDFWELSWKGEEDRPKVFELTDPASPYWHNWNDIAFQLMWTNEQSKYHAQWIPCSGENWIEKAGVNSLLVADLDESQDLQLKCNGGEITRQSGETDEAYLLRLRTIWPHYWWFIEQRPYWYNGNPVAVDDFLQGLEGNYDSTYDHKFLIGIRKAYTLSSPENIARTLYRFKKGNDVKVDVVQTDNVVEVRLVGCQLVSGVRIQEVHNTKPLNYTVDLGEGVLRSFTITPDRRTGINSYYGLPIWKVVATDMDNVMMEDRFLPILHTVRQLDSDEMAQEGDLVAAVPLFNRSRHVESCNWTFINKSNPDEVVESFTTDDEFGGAVEPYAAAFNTPTRLSPGYWEVCLHFATTDGIEQDIKYTAGFGISK